MNIIQMLGLALSTVVLTNVLKQYRPEFATVVITILGALFFVYISSSVTKIFDYISRICNYTGINIIYIGVSYICEFVSAVCKDAGVSSVAVKVDIAGKLIILLASMPVFKELINIIIGIAT